MRGYGDILGVCLTMEHHEQVSISASPHRGLAFVWGLTYNGSLKCPEFELRFPLMRVQRSTTELSSYPRTGCDWGSELTVTSRKGIVPLDK